MTNNDPQNTAQIEHHETSLTKGTTLVIVKRNEHHQTWKKSLKIPKG
jgi:ABC-type phosphate transport system ATPase subunit